MEKSYKAKTNEKSLEEKTSIINRFIKEKRYLLPKFENHRKTRNNIENVANENKEDIYAIMPPLDRYMDVDEQDGFEYAWEAFRIDDLVIGRITSIQERKIVIRLLCFDGEKSRYIENYNIESYCPVSEIPKMTNHENPLLRYKSGNLVRGKIIEVNPRKERLVVSFYKDANDQVFLGKIEDHEDLPVSYKRQISLTDSYEKIMTKSAGFSNPKNVEYLMSKLNIPSACPHPSLMNKLNNVKFDDSEFAPALRKRQCSKVARKAVQDGVEKFKKEKYIEAMEDFNYALEMDTENVDALVARGALYANRSSYLKAISDFENALKLNPSHKNAKKYAVEVFLERAKQIEPQVEDMEQINEVERCYKKALHYDPDCKEAKIFLGDISVNRNRLRAQANLTESKSEETDQQIKNEKDADNDHTNSAKKIREFLKHEIKGESSSSSSSSSDSDSSSSSSSTSSSSSSSSSTSPRRRKNSSRNNRNKTPSAGKSNNRRRSSHHSKSPIRKDKKSIKRHHESSDSDSNKDNENNKNKKSMDSNKKRRTSADNNSNRQRQNLSNSNNRNNNKKFENNHNRSHTAHAAIPSSRRSSYNNKKDEKRDVFRRKSSHESVPKEETKRIENTRRKSLPSIPKVTKDNFGDILKEISKYEKLSK